MNVLSVVNNLNILKNKTTYEFNGTSFVMGNGSTLGISFTSNSQTISGQSNTKLNGIYNFTYSSTQGTDTLYKCFNSSNTITNINFVSNGPYDQSSSPNNYKGSANVNVGGKKGDWIKIQFPNKVMWTSYVLAFTLQGSEWIDRYAYTFYILGSNDDNTWTELDYYSQNDTTNPIQQRTISSPNYYKYYTYVVTQIRPNVKNGVGVTSLCYFIINGKT